MTVLCVECFFFFKQKTAYEMRISDWSSDVCSSDLLRKASSRRRCASVSKEKLVSSKTVGSGLNRTSVPESYPSPARSGRSSSTCEIGSESCRERVCQDV